MQRTQDQVKYSLHSSIQQSVDKAKVVSLNSEQSVVHHSIDPIIVNRSSYLHGVVLNNLSKNQLFSDTILSPSMIRACDGKDNLCIESVCIWIEIHGRYLPGLFESSNRSDANVAAIIGSIFNVFSVDA